MKKFKVRRRQTDYGVLEAESREEAVVLMKYGHYPLMWGSDAEEPTEYKLLDEIIDDDNNES